LESGRARLWDEYEVVDAYSSNRNRCFVALTTDDRVIGFIFGDEIRKHASLLTGYVHWIAVDPLFHRRGIGLSARPLRTPCSRHPH
jgi:ribosomal protein S18 acetylase RimI-like enzyme